MFVVTSAEEKKLFNDTLELLNVRLALLVCPKDFEDPQVCFAWGFSLENKDELSRNALAERTRGQRTAAVA